MINAAGVINCYREVHGLSEDATKALIENIYPRTLEIFKKATDENIPTQEAAIKLAMERIETVKNKK